MNKRFFMILAVITCAMIVAVIVVSVNQKKEEGVLSAGDVVFPTLKADLANVNRIVVSGYDAANKAELKHEANGWVVTSRFNYPASFPKIRTLLDALSTAKYYEAKTANPESYALLGVADQQEKDSEGALVEVYVDGKAQPYQLIVGKLAATWDGSYARKPHEAQSWLLDKQIPVEKTIPEWLLNDIVTISDDRILQIEHNTPDHKTLLIAKADHASKHYDVQNIPKDQLRYDDVADGMARNLNGITLMDVQPAAQFSFDDAITYQDVYKTYEGLVINLKTEKKDGRYYLAVQASFDENIAKQYNANTAAEQNATTQPKTTMIDGKAESEKINSRFTNWVYEINEYNFTNLTKTSIDMLKEATPTPTPIAK